MRLFLVLKTIPARLLRLLKGSTRPLLLLLQALFLALAAFGVGLIYLPAGVILAGVLGAVVIERQT